jgi:hypothetical protein
MKQVGAVPIGEIAPGHTNSKGGDPDLWPEDLRVREYPDGRHA